MKIQPFAELAAVAAAEAHETQGALIALSEGTGPTAGDPVPRMRALRDAHLAILCDLSRPISHHVVTAMVAAKVDLIERWDDPLAFGVGLGRYPHCGVCKTFVWSVGVEYRHSVGAVEFHCFASPGDCDDPPVDERLDGVSELTDHVEALTAIVAHLWPAPAPEGS